MYGQKSISTLVGNSSVDGDLTGLGAFYFVAYVSGTSALELPWVLPAVRQSPATDLLYAAGASH